MTPVVVAWCVQVAWEIVRCVLGSSGSSSGVDFAISTAVTLATTTVLAVGFAGIARRTTGVRRGGALVACGAYVAMIGVFVAREILLQAHSPHAMGFARMLRDGGWSLLEAVAILGLAIAAGRRGKWLALPAIGLVFLALPPSAVYISATLGFAVMCRILATGICIALVTDAQRAMTPRDPKPAAAARGALVAERVCWFFAAINVASLVAGGAFTIGPALAVAIANIVGGAVSIVAIWWIASAGIARLPRAPLYASAVLALCWLMRTTRNWLLTIFVDWGHLDKVPLHRPHWAYSIPSALSALLGVIAYFVYARRSQRPAVLVPVVIAGVTSIGHLALWIAGAGHQVSEAALLATNIASAVMFRALRPVFQAEVPPQMPAARVV